MCGLNDEARINQSYSDQPESVIIASLETAVHGASTGCVEDRDKSESECDHPVGLFLNHHASQQDFQKYTGAQISLNKASSERL